MSDIKSVNNSIKIRSIDKQQLLNLVIKSIFAVFVILTIRYQIKLLSYIEWGDESETIVAAKMIAAGSSLYSEIFNHHGPLTFFPGVLLEYFGDFGIQGHRVPILILQWLAFVSLYFSPLLKENLTRKIYIVVATTAVVVFMPEFLLFGHTYIYQVIAGLLFVIILAQYTLPAISDSKQLSTFRVALGTTLIVSLPFLSVTYLPAAALLYIASLTREFLRKQLLFAAIGLTANVLFLELIGSFSGYLAYHIYLNAKILPAYNGDQTLWRLIYNAFSMLTSSINVFVVFILTVAAVASLASYDKSRFPWRAIIVAIAIGSLLMRGINFHGIPFWYACTALPLVFFIKGNVTWKSLSIWFIFVLVCFLKISLLLPADKNKIQAGKIPETSEFSELVKALTDKNDRIISYSFQNFQYIVSDRLPASGHFFYLPWQEKYNEHPKFGVKTDACQDIKSYKPKIMLIDKWLVWDKYPWDSYGGCIQKIIDEYYIQIPERPYFVRKDILSKADMQGITISGESYKMQPSPQLGNGVPINLFMAPRQQDEHIGLKRIGVMFGTYGRQNPGDAGLHLKGPDGAEFVQRFFLPDLTDNKYRYFDLDSKRYTSGEILSITGGGVSTWESHNEKGGGNTCITYEYNNGKRRFTPGCPLF